MKKQEYLKYVTEQTLQYFASLPRSKEQKEQKKSIREPWPSRMFGVLPLGIAVWRREREQRREAKRGSHEVGADSDSLSDQL